MFERFSASARLTVLHAQDEAVTLGHGFIGTEHLLLGILRLDDGFAREVLERAGVTHATAKDAVLDALEAAGVGRSALPAADALASIGIDVELIRQRADETFGPGALRFPQPPFTPRGKKVLEASLRSAVLFAHYAIEPEHLLLGLIGETEGVAAKVLVEMGVNLADTEHALRARIAPLHTRLAELGSRVSGLAQRLARLPEADRERARPILVRLQQETGRAYDVATEKSRQAQQELVDELSAVLDAAREASAAAGLPDVT